MLEVPRPAMLELMAKIPELGDHVITVFAARRRLLIEERRSAVTVIGAERDPAVQRVASFLSRKPHPVPELRPRREVRDRARAVRAGPAPAVR
jgi:thioredoxin reductase (NADPH)